jgi:ATP-dependent Clp protease, protease subunit
MVLKLAIYRVELLTREETIMLRECFIRFMAPVHAMTADSLLRAIDRRISQGVDRINLLIATPGGTVFHGLSIYNYLRGAPVEVHTYNFGSVDSIGVVLFCAGSMRFSVPHSRFLIHGVRMNFSGQISMDEKQLDEHQKSLDIDQRNIARVIASTCEKTEDQVMEKMQDRTTFDPEEAKLFGLVHEIKSDLVTAGADIEFIYEHQQQPVFQPGVIQQSTFPSPEASTETKGDRCISVPLMTGFTRSFQIDHFTGIPITGTI